MKKFYSHYDWLHENFYQFLLNLGITGFRALDNTSCIGAHGDKGSSYKNAFDQACIPFEHGIAVYLLTYISPWKFECRETDSGWVDPCKWVIANMERFKKFLPPAIDRNGE